MAEAFFMSSVSYYENSQVFEPRIRKRHRNALYTAAETGRLNKVNILLAIGHNPDRQDPYGITPLQIAAWNNHCKVVVKLAKRGSDVNLADRLGHTAIFKSVWRGCKQCVCNLLSLGAKSDVQDHSGNTPLMLAAELGHIAILEILLKEGAKTEIRNKWGESALYIAAAHTKVSCVEALLKYKANPDARTLECCTPLFVAVSRMQSEKTIAMVQLLLQVGADMEIKGQDVDVNNGRRVTPLELACYLGNFDIARLLLVAGCSVNPIRKWRQGHMCPFAFKDEPEELRYFLEVASKPLSLACLTRAQIRKGLIGKCEGSSKKLGLPPALVEYVDLSDVLNIGRGQNMDQL